MSNDDRNNPSIGNSGAATGIGMASIFGNIIYAGMRAQGSQDRFGRAFAFVLGFPATLLTYFVVDEGSERAYGVDLPRKRPQNP
jgi:hypothetical protein